MPFVRSFVANDTNPCILSSSQTFLNTHRLVCISHRMLYFFFLFHDTHLTFVLYISLSIFFHLFATKFLLLWQDWVTTPCHTAMADCSTVTVGTARSLLVDFSVNDSRMAETSKEQTFLGLTTDDMDGKCISQVASIKAKKLSCPFIMGSGSMLWVDHGCFCIPS